MAKYQNPQNSVILLRPAASVIFECTDTLALLIWMVNSNCLALGMAIEGCKYLSLH